MTTHLLLAFALAIWLLPLFDIVNSTKVTGEEKLLWLLGCLCLSWFLWIAFYLFAPIQKNGGFK